MCYLSSAADDAPGALIMERSPTVPDLLREQSYLHQHAGNIARLVDGFRGGDASYTPAVRRMTLAAVRNALEAYSKTLDAIEAEVLPVRSLPAVVSVGSL